MTRFAFILSFDEKHISETGKNVVWLLFMTKKKVKTTPDSRRIPILLMKLLPLKNNQSLMIMKKSTYKRTTCFRIIQGRVGCRRYSLADTEWPSRKRNSYLWKTNETNILDIFCTCSLSAKIFFSVRVFNLYKLSTYCSNTFTYPSDMFSCGFLLYLPFNFYHNLRGRGVPYILSTAFWYLVFLSIVAKVYF